MAKKVPYDPYHGKTMKGGNSPNLGNMDPNQPKTMQRSGKTGSQHGKLQNSGKKS